MRNLKKFLALVLAMLMIVSAAATVSAFSDVAEDNQYATAIDDLVEKKIINGVGDDKFDPDGSVTRWQMALMIARALTADDTIDWSKGTQLFADVDQWYGAINYAYSKGIVTGIGNNLFAPNEGIKYHDALIMALRALGYTVDVTGDPYYLAGFFKAEELGLTANVDIEKADKALTRAETAQILYNMLGADRANSELTFAEELYGEANVKNTTTFVITATANQAYAETAKSVDKDYVGIQPLVNGIPTGDITYIPAAILGIDADKADNFFNYAVNFVNYDAETGTFDKVALGDAPTVVVAKEVAKSGTKITVDGVTYYPAVEITGAALKNEIVIYNGGSEAKESRILLKDADGDIIDKDGTKLAIFAYQSANGTKYYADKINAKVISESVALDKYGVIVEGSYTEYKTLTTADLGNNYQLTMFDDDNDGKFERAIYTTVYMSVFAPNNSNGTSNVVGIAGKKATFTNTDLKKGDFFTFTYNEQTKVVDVIDVLTPVIGKIEKLDLTNFKSDKSWTAVVTIDGVNYKVANDALAASVGASFQSAGTAYTTFKNITDNGKANFNVRPNADGSYNIADVLALYANIGGSVQYVAYNGYIIFAETYTFATNYDFMVINEAYNYDSTSIYVDAYLNGERGTYKISAVNGTKFADMNAFTLPVELQKFASNAKTAIYKAVKQGDGTYSVLGAFDRHDTDSQSSFGIYATSNIRYVFTDGISGDFSTAKETRLRTDANTKFYFINRDKQTVSLYQGAAANNWVLDASQDTSVMVLADKYGWGNTNAGVATKVVVYYKNADVTDGKIVGFNIKEMADTVTVYIANPGTYTVDSAANFGLTGKSGTYAKYGDVAINMATGAVSSVYAPIDALLTRGFYIIDKNGIATKTVVTGTPFNGATETIDFDNQYITVGTLITPADKVTKLVTVATDNLTIKNDKTYLGKATAVYMTSKANGVAVLVVDTTAIVPPVDPTQASLTSVNAYWNDTTSGTAAIRPGQFYSTIGDKKVTGTLVALKDKTFTDWYVAVSGTKLTFISAGVNYTVTSIKFNGTNVDLSAYTAVAEANADGNLEITLIKKGAEGLGTAVIDAGSYVITVGNDVNADTYTVTFTK